MNATDLTSTINAMDEDKIEHLLKLLAEVELTISLAPRTGLMMLTVQDSFGPDFHLGEILVTEARVLLHGSEGFGMVIGEAPRYALAKAAADAVLRCPECPLVKQKLLHLLCREGQTQHQEEMRQAALVAATTVNFDLMPGA